MATLISSMMDSIKIKEGMNFVITEMMDEDSFGVSLPDGVLPTGNPKIAVGRNGVIITSGSRKGTNIYVRFELWDDIPEPLDSWEKIWTGELNIGSGAISLAQYLPEEWDTSEPFTIGDRGLSWCACVQTKTLVNKGEVDFPDNIFNAELYRMQLWRPGVSSE
ncbi:hypothetical protein [Streptosporangium roseum]|uniref:hypothetical protein n=1 Tax=Streptosporangium roseum TaxID=2001 RepID=UPI00332743C3